MFISILIPVKSDNKYLRESIEHCLLLDYSDFEIIVLPDGPMKLPYIEKVKVVPTGSVGPAKKRDVAVREAKGEILAFIDDDVFPDKDWLKNAIVHFERQDVAAACGPAVTPPSDDIRQTASGAVYSSIFVSGLHNRRYVPAVLTEVDDYPSCNFLIRRDVFQEAGGFDTTFWPGEDTILCLKITKELNKKIIYDPKVLVYHHRRPLFIPHLNQIKQYALHRGYFVKHFPQTSFRLTYFLPSILVLGLISGLFASMLSPMIKRTYLIGVAAYLILAAASVFKGKTDIRLKFLTVCGIIVTHLVYGVYFIKGLFAKSLAEE